MKKEIECMECDEGLTVSDATINIVSRDLGDMINISFICSKCGCEFGTFIDKDDLEIIYLP